MSEENVEQPAETVQDEQHDEEQKDEITSSEQQDALKQAFDDLDIDQSGTISRSELRAALQLIGQNPTEEEVRQYMEGVSEDGQFTKEEFFDFVDKHVSLKTKDQINEELIDAFEMFDENKDMFIDKEEFRRVMTKRGDEPLTEKEADDLMERLDTIDADGKLSIVELGKLFLGND